MDRYIAMFLAVIAMGVIGLPAFAAVSNLNTSQQNTTAPLAFSQAQFNQTLTSVNSTALQATFDLPKFSLVYLANFTLRSTAFNGNVAYTPLANGIFPTALCTTNHTKFNGSVFINGVNTTVTNATFKGGLYSIAGSCQKAPSCGSSLSCNPSTSCCTTASSSSSQSDTSPYTGGSCSSSVVYSQAVTSQSNTAPSWGSGVTCNSGVNQCSDNPSCSLSYLSYEGAFTPYGSSLEGAASDSCPLSGISGLPCGASGQGTSCSAVSVSDIGTQHVSSQCGTFNVPSASESCVPFDSDTYGTHGAGYKFTCNGLGYTPSTMYDAGCNMLNPTYTVGNPSATSLATCSTSGGCAITAPAYLTVQYTAPASTGFLGTGDSYTIPSITTDTCTTSTVTVPDGDYYSYITFSTFSLCTASSGPELSVQQRVDYPYWAWYSVTQYSTQHSLQEDAIGAGNSYTLPELGLYNTGAGTCFVQNQLSQVGIGSQASVSSNSNYACSGTYNSSTPNYCLTSSPGTLVYSASCPASGSLSGSFSSVEAIKNSCFSTFTNSYPSSLKEILSNTTIYNEGGSSNFIGPVNISMEKGLKSALKACTPSNGNCSIYLNASSSTAGLLEYKNFTFSMRYNLSALYTKAYNLFNDTQAGLPIQANSTVDWGANLTMANTPSGTVKITGFSSSISACQLMLQGSPSVYGSLKNSSDICPYSLNMTRGASWSSFKNTTVDSIYVFNRHAKPVVQNSSRIMTQYTQKLSIPGDIQYVTMPITFKDNQSDYGVSSAISVRANTPTVSGFSLSSGAQSVFSISSNATENLLYSGDKVTSNEVISPKTFLQGRLNIINVSDTWNNTSPVSFTDLSKLYLLPEGAEFKNCYINGSSVKGTNECVVTNESNKSILVNMTFRHPLPAGIKLDPTLTYVAPNTTFSETPYSQVNSLICTVSYTQTGSYVCANSTVTPSWSATASYNNTGGFAYQKVNLSATIPKDNDTLNFSIALSPPKGVNYTIYSRNLQKGIINFTTWNFKGNTQEIWGISLETTPLNVTIKDHSSSSTFDQNINYTSPINMTYYNIQVTEDTSFLASYELCSSGALLSCTPPGSGSLPGSNNRVQLASSISGRYATTSISSFTGSQMTWLTGPLGRVPKCSILYQNQTNVTTGQNIIYWQKINCVNNNTIPLSNFQIDWNMSSTAFNIYSAQLYRNGSAVAPGLKPTSLFVNPGFFIPLIGTYTAGGNLTFLVTFEVQPLVITYQTVHPSVFYTNVPALSTINVSLSNQGSIQVNHTSYAIPLSYGLNASFITDELQASNESRVLGYYNVQFSNIKPHTTVFGTIYYYTPVANVTSYPPYSVVQQATSIVYYIPFGITSTSPIPMADVNFVSNIVYNGTGVCSTVAQAFLTNSPGSKSGTSVPFSCLPGTNDETIKVNIGPMNLGQIEYLILYANVTLGARIVSQPPSGGGSAPGIIQALQAVWNGIVWVSKEVSSFFSHI